MSIKFYAFKRRQQQKNSGRPVVDPPVYRWSHLRVWALRLALLWGIRPFTIFLHSLYSSILLKAAKLAGITPDVPQWSLSFYLAVILGFRILFSQPAGNSSPVGGRDGWPLQCSGLAQLVLPGRDLALVAASCAPIVEVSTVQALGVSPFFFCMPFALSRYSLGDQPGPSQASLQPQPCLLLLKPVQLILTHSLTHSSSGPTAVYTWILWINHSYDTPVNHWKGLSTAKVE